MHWNSAGHAVLQVSTVGPVELPTQPSIDNPANAEPLQHPEGSLFAVPGSTCDVPSPLLSQSGSGLSRPPTQQEIQHMDDLDLSVNIGSLLGPEDSWIGASDEHFAALGQANNAMNVDGAPHNSKPFQELFSVAT